MFDTTEYIVEETKKNRSSEIEGRRTALREPNKEDEGIEMQILNLGVRRNEPSTSGYHRNEPNAGRQSSSTSTDSGLHIQEKIICDWPIKSLNNPHFVDKPAEENSNRRYDRACLQSLSEIWKYQDERAQDFITVSTDCFTNESNALALKRDPKCASSDYSTSSDAFSKDKDVGRTNSYQLVFTSSDIDYPIVEHCEDQCSSHGIIHTTIDSDDDEEAGSRSPLLNSHEENWKKICAEVKGIFHTESDIEIAFIEKNKPKEVELKPPVESPETLGIDWLFEHTESESESSDIKGNFYIKISNFNLFKYKYKS